MIPQAVHESWYDLKCWSRLPDIKSKLSYIDFYPLASEIFRGFSIPRDEVRAVIIGLAPYNNKLANGLPMANGIAFQPREYTTPSFRVMEDCYLNDFYDITKQLSFENVSNVMFLNMFLTVAPYGKPDSHAYIWDGFIQEVVKEFTGTIFALLGKVAQSLVIENNHVLKYVHPAATARMSNPPEFLDFRKSGMFKAIDELGMHINGQPIWN